VSRGSLALRRVPVVLRRGGAPRHLLDGLLQPRQIPSRDTLRWLGVVAETDLALKGSRKGSKRPRDAVLEDTIARLWRR
jgi:hypothetical protein